MTPTLRFLAFVLALLPLALLLRRWEGREARRHRADVENGAVADDE